MTRSRWVVTVARDHDVTRIADELGTRGFTDMQVLHQVGLIVGVAPDEVVDAVRSMSGIEDVSLEGEIDLGPPDAPVS